MQILKVPISEIKRFRKYIFQFHYQGKKLYAHPLFEEWDIEDIFASKALILKLRDYNYLLGFNGQVMDHYTEYMLGKKLIIREYKNGNLAGFRRGEINSAPAVLHYQKDQKTLSFDRQVFPIDLEHLPAGYLVKMQGDKTDVKRLLNSPEFCALSGVPRETLRQWIIRGKFEPAKLTEKWYAYFSPEQVAPAQILHNSHSDSAEIRDLILQAVQHLENDTIVHLNFFKQLVPDYNRRRYSTLRMIIQQLLAEKKLMRVSCGYYKKNNKTD